MGGEHHPIRPENIANTFDEDGVALLLFGTQHEGRRDTDRRGRDIVTNPHCWPYMCHVDSIDLLDFLDEQTQERHVVERNGQLVECG